MGCAASTSGGANNEKFGIPGPLVFTPGQRSLIECKWKEALSGRVSPQLTNRLADARLRLAGATGGTATAKPDEAEGAAGAKRKKAPPPAAKKKDIAAIVKTAEEYLPLLLGLTKEDGSLSDAVEFGWTNEEDNERSTLLKSAHYELVSVLHVAAVATLEDANATLQPRQADEGTPAKVTKEAKKGAIDTLLRAAGILDAALTTLATSPDIKAKAPADIKEGTLQALKCQALAQAAELQLVSLEEEVKTPLDTKRKLSTVAKQLWQQAASSLAGVAVAPGWGEKHKAYLQWKLSDASAVAYYYYGLVLDEGKEKNTHANAVACFKKAEVLLKEGAIACKEFGMTEPLTRTPPAVGPMLYLHEKIPRDAMSKARINKDVYYMEKEPETAPPVPDVATTLVPTPYKLPPIDPAWLAEKPGPKPPPAGGAKIQEEPVAADGQKVLEPHGSIAETSTPAQSTPTSAEAGKVAEAVPA